MSVAVPLTVRLKTARRDVHVTAELRDLSFRSVAPGGFASATFSLDRPLALQPEEIAYYGRVYVYDARSGETVWEGRLEDPGRGIGDGGQIWSITATGGSAAAQDRTIPVIYVDKRLDAWARSAFTTSTAKTSVASNPYNDDLPVLEIEFPTGTVASPSNPQWTGDWMYRGLLHTGQKLGRVTADVYSFILSADWEVTLATRVGSGAGTKVDPHLLAGEFPLGPWTANGTRPYIGALAAGPNEAAAIPSGHNVVSMRLWLVSGAGYLASYDVEFAVQYGAVTVRPLLMNALGADITAAASYTLPTVTPAQVITDLLGRALPDFDGAGASIADSGYGIDQLAYPDGVTPEQVLTDLMALDPAYYWAAWESNAAGKFRFEWTPWPTTVRYEADVHDGFNAPGSADGLFNTVTVRYTDARGTVLTVTRTRAVQVLTDAGITRGSFLDLGDDLGSLANAQRVGDNFLAEHAAPPNRGTLTVARPIYDAVAGRMVSPWEIRPGNLVRVRGVLPRADALNVTARDGVTVFKIAAVDFSASSASAQLELDAYPRSVSAALAKLRKNQITRRR